MKDFEININNKSISANKIISLIENYSSKEVAKIIIDDTECDAKEAFKVIKELKQLSNTQKTGRMYFDIEKQKFELKNKKDNAIINNQPKCPTCNSTNIRKIGTGERTASVVGFGLLSKKINKTWKCNNCGHTW